MGIFTIKLPDVGEGIAEAELVEWNVKLGDLVREDQAIAAVMTDKTTIEIPSEFTGKVVWLGGEIGQRLAIGCDLVRIDVDGREGDAVFSPEKQVAERPQWDASPAKQSPQKSPAKTSFTPVLARNIPNRPSGDRPLAAPSVRQRARTEGIELGYVRGSGPAGRISHEDVSAYLSGQAPIDVSQPPAPQDVVRETKIIGLRRKIAERMANAKRRIPHITIVEEVDVTALETLRDQLNAGRGPDRPKLTVLPFLMAALSRAICDQPMMNAHYDDDHETLREFSAVHIGIATQTKAGLMVPVVRHCEHRSLWQAASELGRVTEAARAGKASRDDLTGSTITISSLGPLGAIATTPIVNHPEVAIVGVNRMEIRPKWDGSHFVPRMMMNLSSSFDHRVIDGWDAALFVKRIKSLLETPALMFVES